MSQELSAHGVLFAEGHLATDDYLLSQAIMGNTVTTTQLWSRYYTRTLVEASRRATKAAPPDKVMLRGFQRALTEAKKHDYDANTFVTTWFHDIKAPSPDSIDRSIIWAFYALPARNRILVWRHSVDEWTPRKLAHATDSDENSIDLTLDQVLHQFAGHVTLAMALLGQTPQPTTYLDPTWRTTALPQALMDSTQSIIIELGPRVPIEYVITPPPLGA
jgi:hypothetical protein